jgi:hypothetical protein
MTQGFDQLDCVDPSTQEWFQHLITSVPHLTHPRGNIGMRGGSGCSCAFSGVYRPSPAFEEIEDGVRNEPATRREHVRVTVSVLLAPEKPERLDQMKVQLGTRHGDAQNAAFFFDLFRATRRHVGRYATIRQI